MGNIMLVDDAAFLRAILKDIVESGGHKVIAEAADGAEAVDKYRLFRPDLVILDISMPGMGGMTALQLIMKEDPQAKVVMCSALGNRQLILESVRLGAIDFILKPFRAERVMDAVQRAFYPAAKRAAD